MSGLDFSCTGVMVKEVNCQLFQMFKCSLWTRRKKIKTQFRFGLISQGEIPTYFASPEPFSRPQVQFRVAETSVDGIGLEDMHAAARLPPSWVLERRLCRIECRVLRQILDLCPSPLIKWSWCRCGSPRRRGALRLSYEIFREKKIATF